MKNTGSFLRFLVVFLPALFLASLSVAAQSSNVNSSASVASVSPAKTGVVPSLVSYSGVLKDASGRIVTGIAGVTFLLYKDSQGGAPLWMETQSVTPDKTGHYAVQLGSTTSAGLPSEMFISGEARWLGVQVAGEAEQPRVLLVAVPYAMKAADAETVGGLPPSAFMLAAPVSTNSGSANSTSSTSAAPATAPPASSNVTTTGGTVNAIPLFTTATNIQNSLLTQTTTTAVNVVGKLNHPATGTATATAGKNSQPDDLIASAFNSSTAAAVNQTFQLQAEPSGNNTATPSGTLNVLYGSGTTAPAETGLKISSKGLLTFATGQTFPGTGTITGVTTATGSGLTGGGTTGTLTLSLLKTCTTNQTLQWNGTAWACATVSGSGTITGVTAGTDLTGGGTSGNVTLNLNTAALQTSNDARYAQLNANNVFSKTMTFAAGQTFPGTGSGTVTSVGLAAPATDFTVSGSPVTTSGTLNFNWNIAPTPANTANAIVKRDGSGNFSANNITASNIFALGVTPNSLVSTVSAPASALWLAQNVATAGGSYGIAGYTSSAVYPSAGVLGDGPGYGLWGQTESTITSPGSGVIGVASAGSGTAQGVQGFTYSPLGTGVYGAVQSASALGLGFHQANPTGQGVWGDTGQTNGSNSAGYIAVMATADDAYAGFFANSAPSGATVLEARAYNAASNPLETFGPNGECIMTSHGDLDCTGAIIGAVKNFRLDHPLDPANKYLVHASVESSEMKNIYDGVITTDTQGEATVQLPDWFEAENGNFRYQLTVMGQFAQAIVAREIASHEFAIKTSLPFVKVSWQVTGVRKDAWAQSHPLVVEEQKDEKTRGYYIHPELYGAPREKAIEWARHPEELKLQKRIETEEAKKPVPPVPISGPRASARNNPPAVAQR